MANAWVNYAIARPDAAIVALVDIRRESAQAMADKHGLSCGIYTDLASALQETTANLVFDITIPAVHREVVLTALSHSCDVLGEKPMAPSMEEAKLMVDAAVRSGRMYAVMQNRRFLQPIRAYKHILESGTIGKLGFLTAQFFVGPRFGGFRDAMDSPLLLDMAIHTFDQARFLIGADPVSVYCHEFNPAGSWYQGRAAAACIFEFGDGIVFTFNGSWAAQGVPTSWDAEWRAIGSHGTAIWDGNHAPYAEVVVPETDAAKSFIAPTKRTEAEFQWGDRQERHDGCLDEMFAALIEGRDAETVCTDNIKSMAMVYGALESARIGQKVQL